LRVLKWPLECALQYTLAYAEYTNNRATLGTKISDTFVAPVNIKKTLEILIPLIYKLCAPQVTCQLDPADEKRLLADVDQGLEFCRRYEVATMAFTEMHQSRLSANAGMKAVTFTYPSLEVARASLLDFVLQSKLAEDVLDQAMTSGDHSMEPSQFSAGLHAKIGPSSISWQRQKTT
jgi:hypothetical protein